MAIRNIAIIAHVDHGKTTLVDALLTQSGTMKYVEGQDLIMDNNDQERERGITIYSKNTSVVYEGNTINIIDTPGHADFGSEVERVLKMVDSVLLVVDAYEGPMPQTKFVLKKSLERGLKPIVIINKIDKPTARPEWVINELFDAFISLGADDDQADFPIIYASAKNGYAFDKLEDLEQAKVDGDIKPIFNLILNKVPEAPNNTDKPFRMQIANLGYDDFVGRLGIGRVYDGVAKAGQQVIIYDNKGNHRKGKISKLYTTFGLSRIESQEASCGDIVTIAGIPDIFVGETVGVEGVEPFEAIKVDEPTLTMDFLVNDSPFAGQDGKQVTSRNLIERLEKELETNVGLEIDFEVGENRFAVSGRGELHLSVLIETMRREGFELQVSAPQVIFKENENGKKQEPIEQVVVTIEESLSGSIIDALAKRKGQMTDMNTHFGTTTLQFEVPTRGLLGFRSEFILMTKGEGIMYTSFLRYDDYKGDISKRNVGSMISMESGKAMRYSIWKLQDRGTIFVDPATDLYEGMIVGESAKPGDMTINLTKNKQQSNMRTAGNDENMLLNQIKVLTLEDALSYIGPDEYVEITPKNIRLRKIYLKEGDRKRLNNMK
ncbi:MAG TPA: translational GTPase TypA [Candidatus Absconditabacterales bacterium]|nr:translational GTPase TypA [Candidatus Absconditabacterales bacterium]